MARLMEVDRLELGGLPGLERPRADGGGHERRARRAAEEQVVVAAAAGELVRRQDGAELSRDRDGAGAGVALRVDLALVVVPAAADVDDVTLEVDVASAQRPELAAAQAGVHGGRPLRSLAVG